MNVVDALIVGGGPAGMSCALELSASGIECLVLEQGERLGGQLFDLWHGIPNLGTGLYESGSALAAAFCQSVETFNCPHRLSHPVESIDLRQRSVRAAGQQYKYRALVLATGYSPRRLPADRGAYPEQVLYLFASSDVQDAMTGARVVVAGGGDSAVCLAIDLAGVYESLHILHRSPRLRCRPDFLDKVKQCPRVEIVMDTQITTIGGDTRLRWVEVTNERSGATTRLDADYLAVKIGYAPNVQLVDGQLELDASGHVCCSSDGETSGRESLPPVISPPVATTVSASPSDRACSPPAASAATSDRSDLPS